MHVSWGVTVKVDLTKMSTQCIYIQALWHTHTHTLRNIRNIILYENVYSYAKKILNIHFNWEMVKYEG